MSWARGGILGSVHWVKSYERIAEQVCPRGGWASRSPPGGGVQSWIDSAFLHELGF